MIVAAGIASNVFGENRPERGTAEKVLFGGRQKRLLCKYSFYIKCSLQHKVLLIPKLSFCCKENLNNNIAC